MCLGLDIIDSRSSLNNGFFSGSLSNSSGELDVSLGPGASHIKSGHKVTTESQGFVFRELSSYDKKPISSLLCPQQVFYYPSKLAFVYLFPFCLSGSRRL